MDIADRFVLVMTHTSYKQRQEVGYIISAVEYMHTNVYVAMDARFRQNSTYWLPEKFFYKFIILIDTGKGCLKC